MDTGADAMPVSDRLRRRRPSALEDGYVLLAQQHSLTAAESPA
jgi:hypothetical protein